MMMAGRPRKGSAQPSPSGSPLHQPHTTRRGRTPNRCWPPVLPRRQRTESSPVNVRRTNPHSLV